MADQDKTDHQLASDCSCRCRCRCGRGAACADEGISRSMEGCDPGLCGVSHVEQVLTRLREVNDRLLSLVARSEDRDDIGRSTGMLMERYGVGADEALALLVRASQDSGRTLSETAQLLIKTGELPSAHVE